METKLCSRMNSATESSTTLHEVDPQSTYVQSSSQTIINTPDLLDSPAVICSSFINHQTSLPSSSGESRREFEITDLEYGDQFTNSLLLPQQIATASLSSSSNNLLDKQVDSTHSRSPSSPLIESTQIQTILESDLQSSLQGTIHSSIADLISNEHPSTQLNTPPPSKSPVHCELNINNTKLSNPTDELASKIDCQLNERLTEQFNQQILNQQLNDDESISGDEQSDMDECSEGCSSEEEKSGCPTNSKKRSRSPHYCSKKRRKQSNPIRCDFEIEKTNQLDQFNQQLKQLSEASGIEENELINIRNLESLQQSIQNQLCKSSDNNKKSDEDEPEEGLIRKFPNTLSAAANAAARFFLSNHQTGNFVDSTNNSNKSKSSDNGESQINYTYYLATAAAVATNASRQGTKHCLNYCKECCCPFLSTEHERLYRKMENEKQNTTRTTNQERSAFAQQLHSIAQQSKLMQEMESVFGNNYEMGQVPQRNSIDAMQLIKQLGKSIKILN